VLGATLDLATFGIDVSLPATVALPPVLAPGFGHQGASVADLASIYGTFAPGVIVSESRSVLSAGPNRLHASISRRVTEIGAARG
jgi:orotidine-5'-phosphate decarboxylase